MSCTRPIRAWQLKKQYWPNPEKAPKPVFQMPMHIDKYNELPLPCTKCVACLKTRSLGRALQLYCELKTTEGDSYFLTLSYSDEHIPEGHTLLKINMVNFIKRLRKYLKKHYPNQKFRFEQCAEYGEQTFRPHHHMSGFNLTIDDLTVWKDHGQYKSFTSETINKIWGYGRVVIMPLTLPSCIYIAQHVDKKINGSTPMHERTFIHQTTGLVIPPPPDREIVNKETGELTIISGRQPEYSTRSNRPGIGYEWFKKFNKTDLNQDFIVSGDYLEHKMPTYFFKLLEKENPQLFEQFKEARAEYAIKHKKTPQQNAAQDRFNMAKLKHKNKRNVL